MPQDVSVSVVVHQQTELLNSLLDDLERLPGTIKEIIITFNVPEKRQFIEFNYDLPISVITNTTPKGFGANHNFASTRCQGDYFCVINPDIRFRSDPFTELLKPFKNKQIALTAPLIFNPLGKTEDNLRRFPTPLSIAAKLVKRWPKIEYHRRTNPFFVDWAAGMFMLFRTQSFRRMGGFDERYHLYYEDVDICARLNIAGFRIVACPAVSVIHNARRESHQNLRYMKWHLQSMLRFFLSRTYRRALALNST
jgi:GT2 family glycosyltransferase